MRRNLYQAIEDSKDRLFIIAQYKRALILSIRVDWWYLVQINLDDTDTLPRPESERTSINRKTFLDDGLIGMG